jgi:hypothetical protein
MQAEQLFDFKAKDMLNGPEILQGTSGFSAMHQSGRDVANMPSGGHPDVGVFSVRSNPHGRGRQAKRRGYTRMANGYDSYNHSDLDPIRSPASTGSTVREDQSYNMGGIANGVCGRASPDVTPQLFSTRGDPSSSRQANGRSSLPDFVDIKLQNPPGSLPQNAQAGTRTPSNTHRSNQQSYVSKGLRSTSHPQPSKPSATSDLYTGLDTKSRLSSSRQSSSIHSLPEMSNSSPEAHMSTSEKSLTPTAQENKHTRPLRRIWDGYLVVRHGANSVTVDAQVFLQEYLKSPVSFLQKYRGHWIKHLLTFDEEPMDLLIPTHFEEHERIAEWIRTNFKLPDTHLHLFGVLLLGEEYSVFVGDRGIYGYASGWLLQFATALHYPLHLESLYTVYEDGTFRKDGDFPEVSLPSPMSLREVFNRKKNAT